MSQDYTAAYFRSRRMGEALDNPFDTQTRALKGYRRGARMLGDLTGKRVLDVGCGLGRGSWFLVEQGAHVVGVDVSAEAIEWARHTYGAEAGRRDAHLEFWPLDLLAGASRGLGLFDVLTVVDVLEHFPPDEGEELLDRLRLLLKPGGRLFLHVPITANTLDWMLVVKNGLMRRRIRGEVIDHHGDTTHLWRYSVRYLADTLKETGWKTRRLELRAFGPRLPRLEEAVRRGRWTPLEAAQEQAITDWDGVHQPTVQS